MKQKIVNIIGLIGLFIIFIFLVFSFVKSTLKLREGNELIKKNQLKLEKIKEENSRLEVELKKVQNPEFIEKEIRNKYGLVKEGEAVIVLPEPDVVRKLSPQIPEEDEIKPKSNPQKWWDLFK